MKKQANSPEVYISQLPEERQVIMAKLRKIILNNLPNGFEEVMIYGMIGYVVPHHLYPSGYHVDPKTPLPFLNIASQKNFIAVYHMGIYAKPELQKWFVSEYPKYCKRKLDMGKSCIRFKKMEEFPFELIGALVQKMTVEEWISLYEKNTKR